MDIYNVWYDRWYYSPNPHLPHSYFLVNSGSQAHSNHGEREIEILDSENFENPNQSAANFIDKKKKKGTAWTRTRDSSHPTKGYIAVFAM